MQVEVFTKDAPATLHSLIRKAVVEETLKTWNIVKDKNGKEYFTHTGQWFQKALLEASTATNPSRLIYTVTWFSNDVPNEYTKGLYIGRFTEILLEHFRTKFLKLETFA